MHIKFITIYVKEVKIDIGDTNLILWSALKWRVAPWVAMGVKEV